MGQPTDVTLELSASRGAGDSWSISATVCIEASGSSRALRVHTAAVLDGYPNPPRYSRNCLMQDPALQDISVSAGSCTQTTSNIQFDPVSLADEDNIRVIVWAQQVSDSFPAEVYQTAQLVWPLQQSGELSSIEIEPSQVLLAVGTEVVFVASGKDQNGADVELSNPTWSVSGAGGILQPSSGSATVTFTAQEPGSWVITCADEGIEGHASVDIVAALRPTPRRIRARY
jgi:hypothetical protein